MGSYSRLVAVGVLFAAVVLLFAACRQRRHEPLPFEGEVRNVDFSQVRNYFVRSDATLPQSPKISSQAQFDSIFGAAAVMGKGGEPTAVDFDRQFVVAYVLPETDIATTVEPVEVTAEGDVLFCTFGISHGEKQSFRIRPFALIAVDRAFDNLQVALRQKAVGLEMLESRL